MGVVSLKCCIVTQRSQRILSGKRPDRLAPGKPITPADASEQDSAQLLLESVGGLLSGLKGEVVKCSENGPGFQVMASRWLVERTFGRLMGHRRPGSGS